MEKQEYCSPIGCVCGCYNCPHHIKQAPRGFAVPVVDRSAECKKFKPHYVLFENTVATVTEAITRLVAEHPEKRPIEIYRSVVTQALTLSEEGEVLVWFLRTYLTAPTNDLKSLQLGAIIGLVVDNTAKLKKGTVKAVGRTWLTVTVDRRDYRFDIQTGVPEDLTCQMSAYQSVDHAQEMIDRQKFIKSIKNLGSFQARDFLATENLRIAHELLQIPRPKD